MIDMAKKYRTRNGDPVRILCTDSGIEHFPVIALFANESICMLTTDGRMPCDPKESPPFLIESGPYDDFKIDDPVMVRNESSPYGRHARHLQWHARHFAGVRNGKPTAFKEGCTSWSCRAHDVSEWYECRKPTQEEIAESKNRWK